MTAILRNRRLVLLVVCCAAFAGIAAGCGGSDSSSSDVPKGAIAVVDGQPITQAQLVQAVARYNRSAVKAKQATIKPGTDAYTTAVQERLVPYLVALTEFEQQAKKLGVTVTPKEVDASLKKDVIDQYFGGKRSKLLAAIKKQGSTMAEVRETVRLNLLQTKVTKKLTQGIKVTDAEARAAYEKNIANYEKPTSRNLAHILVKTKAKADKLYTELQNGANFATLAKKNSTDSNSAVQGGNLGVQAESSLVKPFSKVAFAIKTGTISKPVHTRFGWHIIKALGPVIPHTVSPFSKEKASIVQELQQAKNASATADFGKKMENYYKSRVKYAKDYEPPKTTTPPATSLAPNTATG
jgi:foldase protein PrsA